MLQSGLIIILYNVAEWVNIMLYNVVEWVNIMLYNVVDWVSPEDIAKIEEFHNATMNAGKQMWQSCM